MLTGKKEPSSEFCLKLLKYEIERRSLLKQYPIEAKEAENDGLVKTLNPTFFPDYILEENKQGEVDKFGDTSST